MNTTVEITRTERSGCAVLIVRGELDLSNANLLITELARTITRDRPTVLDLSGVSFIDATGIRVLSAASNTAAGQDARLTIVPSPAVARLLELVPHDLAMILRPDLASALSAART